MSEEWPVQRADALVCINMIHITPWTACAGLMAGAERTLPLGGVPYLYGAYQINGRHTAQSNQDFDAWLRTTTKGLVDRTRTKRPQGVDIGTRLLTKTSRWCWTFMGGKSVLRVSPNGSKTCRCVFIVVSMPGHFGSTSAGPEFVRASAVGARGSRLAAITCERVSAFPERDLAGMSSGGYLPRATESYIFWELGLLSSASQPRPYGADCWRESNKASLTDHISYAHLQLGR
jgi:hypothetical protein